MIEFTPVKIPFWRRVKLLATGHIYLATHYDLEGVPVSVSVTTKLPPGHMSLEEAQEIDRQASKDLAQDYGSGVQEMVDYLEEEPRKLVPLRPPALPKNRQQRRAEERAARKNK